MDCSWENDRKRSFDDEPASDGAHRSPHMSAARVTPTNHLLKLSTPRRVSFSWEDSPSKRPTSPRLVIFNECSIIDSNEPESPKLQLLKLPLLDNVPPAPKRQRVEADPAALETACIVSEAALKDHGRRFAQVRGSRSSHD